MSKPARALFMFPSSVEMLSCAVSWGVDADFCGAQPSARRCRHFRADRDVQADKGGEGDWQWGVGAAENEETRSDVLPDQLIYID